MWVPKNKWETLEKRVADLEGRVHSQLPMTEITFEFCKSVANKDGMGLLSYQQLNSPSTDSNKKVRMLLEQIRELR